MNISRVVLVEYPVYDFFSVNRQGYSKTETIWFLRAVSTTLHSLYRLLSSLCSQRMCLSSPGGVHAGMVAVLPRLVGKADKGGFGNKIILIRRKGKPEVAVLTSV